MNQSSLPSAGSGMIAGPLPPQLSRPVPAGYQGPTCNLPPCTPTAAQIAAGYMCPQIAEMSYLPPCEHGDVLWQNGTMLNTQNNVNTPPNVPGVPLSGALGISTGWWPVLAVPAIILLLLVNR